MRTLVLIMAAVLSVMTALAASASTAHAQTVPTPTLSLVVFGETVGTRQQFDPSTLLIPQVPINIVLTFHNNDTMDHTFTINDVNGTPARINTGLVTPGQNVTLNFTVITLTQVRYNGTTFTPEAGARGILFYCIPHRAVGMTGQIVLASVVTTTTPEKGILLRAYWIGIIGIAATLLWTVISYFIIKSSSRHFTDHSEHVRKGLP